MGRRAAGEGSIHQRARDGNWCAVLDLGYVKGKRVRRTRTADTQEEAARLLHQLRNEFERGATSIDHRTPLKAWCQEWLTADVEYRASVGQLRQSTAESYERLVRCHLVPHLGHIKLFDLDARTIQRAYQAMLDDLAPSSVSKVHQILRSMLGAADNSTSSSHTARTVGGRSTSVQLRRRSSCERPGHVDSRNSPARPRPSHLRPVPS